MPVWHERAKSAVAKRQLAVVGVIQEQHADRGRLFAQWKGFQWPILHDAINLLGPQVVPIVVAIDEGGFVQSVNPKPSEFDAFVARAPVLRETAKPSEKHLFNRHQLYEQTILAAGAPRDAPRRRSSEDIANGLMLWGTDADLDDAIVHYQKAMVDDPTDAIHFRLGVAYRRRYESGNRKPNDFGKAIRQWQHALDQNPNQYIWRRRIQQYGPRMTKPYAFYDWISQAKAEIATRGEIPIETHGTLTRAELAEPAVPAEFSPDPQTEPDPYGRIDADTQDLVNVRSTIVPPVATPGKTVRVFLDFEPNSQKQVHWTNDAGPAQLWVSCPNEDANAPRVERSLWSVASKEAESGGVTSDENRIVEFEVQIPTKVEMQKVKVSAYALYYICEGSSGTCQYLRKEVSIAIPIGKPK